MMSDWPDPEQILGRFRQWLDETRDEAEALGEDAFDEPSSPDPPVGLYQVVEALTAVRHEVKLLTKASRNEEERWEATLLSLNAAVEQFRAVEAKESEAAHKAARPLVETLIELDESLTRGRQVVETARFKILQEVEQDMRDLRDRLEELYRAQPWWRRALCRPWHRAAEKLYAGRTSETQRRIFDSLLEGYELIQRRMRRAFEEQQIARIPCVGQPVDPNRMTVLETVSDFSRAPGTVVEEVRPGYCWQGRVIRFAEVKAVGQN
jgi:molecular chaperone GrpE